MKNIKNKLHKVNQQLKIIQLKQRLFLHQQSIQTKRSIKFTSLHTRKINKFNTKNKNYPKCKKTNQQESSCYIYDYKNTKIKNQDFKGFEFESLDQTALEILLNIANFEPIPNELNKESSWQDSSNNLSIATS